MRTPIGDIAHLNNFEFGEGFEFLTMATIQQRGGWVCSIPDPDRGADIIARDWVDGTTNAIQVKTSFENSNPGQPNYETAVRNQRRWYPVSLTEEQVNDLFRVPIGTVYVIWLVREGAIPRALVLPGTFIRNRCTRGQGQVFHIYQSIANENDIRFGINQFDRRGNSNNARPNYELWDRYFTPHPNEYADKSMAAASEALTIHRLLMLGGWSAAKPIPDRGADVLSLRIQDDLMVPTQVKASTPQINDRILSERTRNRLRITLFQFRFNETQVNDILRNPEGTAVVLWICRSSDDWGALVFTAEQLMELTPGDWTQNQQTVIWTYVTTNADRTIRVNFGGIRNPTDVTNALERWDLFNDF